MKFSNKFQYFGQLKKIDKKNTKKISTQKPQLERSDLLSLNIHTNFKENTKTLIINLSILLSKKYIYIFYTLSKVINKKKHKNVVKLREKDIYLNERKKIVFLWQNLFGCLLTEKERKKKFYVYTKNKKLQKTTF